MKQVIALLLVFHLQVIAFATPKCDNALSACQDLITEQDVSITILKKQVSTLEQRLADSQPSPIIPTWLIFVLGAAVGTVSTLVIVR